nr:MAG TPA: hypothetical protein [Caudoviricetes sp.]
MAHFPPLLYSAPPAAFATHNLLYRLLAAERFRITLTFLNNRCKWNHFP